MNTDRRLRIAALASLLCLPPPGLRAAPDWMLDPSPFKAKVEADVHDVHRPADRALDGIGRDAALSRCRSTGYGEQISERGRPTAAPSRFSGVA